MSSLVVLSYYNITILTYVLLFISFVGILVLKNNLIVILLLIELIFLSAGLNTIISGIFFQDIRGQIFALILLTISAAEMAIVLSVIILYYRISIKSHEK